MAILGIVDASCELLGFELDLQWLADGQQCPCSQGGICC
jgi:hypothetical protein